MTPLNMVTVYLDQSDWSYLHAGTNARADGRLRELGAAGQVAFLITLHHFEEIAALDEPISRATFLRQYPGTMFTHVSGYDLHAFDVEKMVTDLSLDAGRTIGMERLSEMPNEDLEKLAVSFGHWHAIRKLMEPLHNRRRDLFHLDQKALKLNRGKSTRRDDIAIWRAQIRGDLPEMLRVWERTMNRKATPEELQKIEDRVRDISSWHASLESAGFAPPADLDFDEVFPMLVYIHLPSALKRHRPTLERLVRSWRQLREKASPLACSAVIAEATLNNPDRVYAASEQLDAVHAAFAPAVDIFTGDKRTVDSLRRLPLRGRMIRSNHLDEVVDAIAALATPASGARS